MIFLGAALRKIAIRSGDCYLNGNKDWPVPLSREWKAADLYKLIPAYCQEYEVNYVSEEHVKTIVDKYLLSQNGESLPTEEAKSAAELLMELANQKVDPLFKDQNGFAFAAVSIANHREILQVSSGKFKRYLAKIFWDEHNKVVGSEIIKNVAQILEARAEYEGETYNLNLRVAGYLNSIYYDLTDLEWRSVKINGTGWEIVEDTPTLFTRYNSIAQVEPERDYGSVTLDDFVALTNVKDPGLKMLLKVYIVSLFIPEIAHPILNLYGEKGSAKSMLFRLIKLLVDPGKPELLTLQKDRNEFIQQLAHNYVAYYDNAKHVPGWLSDEACRAVTGGGHTKRKLYSDDDDVIYDYRRSLGFNGIDITLTAEDALDRSIEVVLERIARKERKLETAILAKFEEIRPSLLGYIFDILVRTLNIRPTVELADLPRMADFAVWGEAISRAIGYKPYEFLNTYYANIGRQNIEAIDAHPLGQAIARWVQSWPVAGSESQDWEGSPQELLQILEPIASDAKIDTMNRNWPKAQNYLSRRLNEIRSNLLEGLGIEVMLTRITAGDAKGRAIVKVRKVSPLSSLSSPSTLEEQLGGDSGGSEDTFPTKRGEPERHAQENFVCPICDHNCATYDELERHAVQRHPGKAVITEWQARHRRIDLGAGPGKPASLQPVEGDDKP